MTGKLVASLDEAVARIPDGASIAVGGFGGAGSPAELVAALARTDRTDLHLIANGGGGDGYARLAAEGRVRKLSMGFPFGGPWHDPVLAGRIEIEVLPQGTLAERLRAGGAGIPAFYTPAGVGTALADGTFPRRFDAEGRPAELADAKEVRVFDGRPYVLEHGLRPDFGFVRASKADRLGNLYFRYTARNFNPAVAMAARCTIVQAQEIVEPGELDPADIHVPAVFVDVLVHVPTDAELPPPPRRRSSRIAAEAAAGEQRVGFTREQVAQNIGRDIGAGWYVNLGLGMPLLAARHVAADKLVTMHVENGALGIGGPPERPDPDLTDAGGQPVSLRPGAAIIDSATSFAIVRGGYLDLSVLGGLQVSAGGDLANWYIPGGQTGVGGAMDLVQGAQRVWVAMEHTDRFGQPKIVSECTLAPTGRGVVSRIYTELGVFSLEDGGLELTELAPGVSVDYVRERTGTSFAVRPGVALRLRSLPPALPEDPLIYELRVYHTMPGRLPDLLARFKNLTLPIWERHEIRQVGFWTVLVGENSTDLIYMLAWDSLAQREERWGAFASDPEWLRGRAATEENGQLVASVSNSMLRPTEFSAIQGWPA